MSKINEEAERSLLNKLRFIPSNNADAATRTIDAMLDNLTDAEFDVLSEALGRFGK